MRLMLPTELELSKLRLLYQHIIEFVFLAEPFVYYANLRLDQERQAARRNFWQSL